MIEFVDQSDMDPLDPLMVGVRLLRLCNDSEWLPTVRACGKYYGPANATGNCTQCDSNFNFGCFEFTLMRYATLNSHAESKFNNQCMTHVFTELHSVYFILT